MLIALVILAVAAAIAAIGCVVLLFTRVRALEIELDAQEGEQAAQRRDIAELEDRVLDALDTLDSEVGAAIQAERIIERARGAKVYVVPVARWARDRGGHKRTTGVLVALALVGSAAVVTTPWDVEPEPPRRHQIPATTVPVVVTSRPATTTTSTIATAPTTRGELPATAPPTTPTDTQPSPPPTDLPGELGSVLASLQLGDELPPRVLGEVGVPDLSDISTAQVGDDLPLPEDLVEVIEACLDTDVPSPEEDCPGL